MHAENQCLDCLALIQEVAQLKQALETRDVIGQAKGIIISSMGCTPDEAFDVLRQQSQTENRKLRDIAAELVLTKTRRGFDRLPASPTPARPAPTATPQGTSLRLLNGTDS